MAGKTRSLSLNRRSRRASRKSRRSRASSAPRASGVLVPSPHEGIESLRRKRNAERRKIEGMRRSLAPHIRRRASLVRHMRSAKRAGPVRSRSRSKNRYNLNLGHLNAAKRGVAAYRPVYNNDE